VDEPLARRVPVLLQDAAAEPVPGLAGHAADPEVPHARVHLVGRLAREGQHHDPVGVDPVGDEHPDAADRGERLPAPGDRRGEEGAGGVADDLELLGVRAGFEVRAHADTKWSSASIAAGVRVTTRSTTTRYGSFPFACCALTLATYPSGPRSPDSCAKFSTRPGMTPSLSLCSVYTRIDTVWGFY